MKQALNIVCGLAFIVLLLPVAGCSNGALIDKNSSIDNHNWTYVNKLRFDVNVDDPSIPYNLFMNLRVTGDYKYSNMFVLITEIGPDKIPATKRFEFTLADKEGQWLGEGSGNLYSFQLPFLKGHKFAAKGLYSFYFEQNMRDNPLREVSDVGLRVEKVSTH
jgi:gliding motility-associated lipoprotein GldH